MDRPISEESCRMEEVVTMIGGKWKLLILRHLIYGGTTRFNALQRRIDGITQTMLSKQLRELAGSGLVSRRAYAEVPPRVEYSATRKARNLDDFFMAMHRWGEGNLAPRVVADTEAPLRRAS